MTARWLHHELLSARGAWHGFGTVGAEPPAGLRRPRQVHGARVVRAEDCAGSDLPDADGIVSEAPGLPVAVVTADCVPILLCGPGGRAVAAVHAGWRGLGAGVVEAGVAALAERTGGAAGLVAAVGPHIGPCCYEVDEPVLAVLRVRFRGSLDGAVRPTRPGHAALDLGALVRFALAASGLADAAIGSLADACTRCDGERFHSYRRDGARAGRLVHFVAARRAEA